MSKIKIKRSIFPAGWVHTFEDQLNINNQQELAVLFIDHILKVLNAKKQLVNIQGRDSSQVLSNDYTPTSGEIFYLKGSYKNKIFELTLISKYAFVKKGQVFFNLKETRSIASNKLDLLELITVKDFLFERCRFGLQFFESKARFLGFGSSTLITQNLLLDINQELLKLKIKTENLKNKFTYPLNSNQLIFKLAEILKAVCHYDLEKVYLQN